MRCVTYSDDDRRSESTSSCRQVKINATLVSLERVRSSKWKTSRGLDHKTKRGNGDDDDRQKRTTTSDIIGHCIIQPRFPMQSGKNKDGNEDARVRDKITEKDGPPTRSSSGGEERAIKKMRARPGLSATSRFCPGRRD